MPRRLSPKIKKIIETTQETKNRKQLKTPLRVSEEEFLTSAELVNLFPSDSSERVYLEPFFQNGCVLFESMNQQVAFKRIAVNDEKNSVGVFFKTLRDNKKEFLEQLSFTPYGVNEVKTALTPSADPMEEARRVWIRSRYTLSGKATTAGDWCRNPGESMEWRATTVAKLEKNLKGFAALLKGIAFDGVEPLKFMDKWCKKARTTASGEQPAYPIFCFITAPYMHDDNQLTNEQHLKLLQHILTAPANSKFLVVGYSSELYNVMLKSWNRVELKTNSVEKKKKQVVWYNYDDSFSNRKF